MAWVALICAGLLEVVWAFSMKQSIGFTRPLPTIVAFAAMAASVGLLTCSFRSIPLGTAYTIWTGIGAVGAFTAGILILGEQASAMRISAAAMILGGLIIMTLSGSD